MSYALMMLGGGERVALTIASALAKRGHSVELYGITSYDKSFFEKYYNIDLSTVRFRTSFGLLSLLKVFGHYQKCIIPCILSKAKGFDLIIDTSSNGFYPIFTDARSICYVHYPLDKLPETPLMILFLLPIRNRIGYSFDRYDRILCNSLFTKNEINKLTSQDATVINPPVDIYNGLMCHDKRKSFVQLEESLLRRKSEVMIASLKKFMLPTQIGGWSLSEVAEIPGICRH